MKCPYCSHAESKVLDKRDNPNGNSIRRRRSCLKCSKRFTTYENLDLGFSVIKKDSSKEEFDKQKILAGIQRACEKRPIEQDVINRLADEIESEILRKEKPEIKSSIIGNTVMKRLKKLDDQTLTLLAEDAVKIAERIETAQNTSPKAKYTRDADDTFRAAVEETRERLFGHRREG